MFGFQVGHDCFMGDAFDLAAFDFLPAAVEGGFEFFADFLGGLGDVEEAVLKALDDFHAICLGEIEKSIHERFGSRSHDGVG